MAHGDKSRLGLGRWQRQQRGAGEGDEAGRLPSLRGCRPAGRVNTVGVTAAPLASPTPE